MSLVASVPTCSDRLLKFNTFHSCGSVVFFMLFFYFCVIFLTLVSTLRLKKPLLTRLCGDFFSDVLRDDNRINFIHSLHFVNNAFLPKTLSILKERGGLRRRKRAVRRPMWQKFSPHRNVSGHVRKQ